MDRLVTFGEHFWADNKWDLPPIGPKSGFTWEANGILDVDARGIAFFSFFCPPVFKTRAVGNAGAGR
jgi:hypothetical protein